MNGTMKSATQGTMPWNAAAGYQKKDAAFTEGKKNNMNEVNTTAGNKSY